MDTIKPFYDNGHTSIFDRFVVCNIKNSYRCLLMGIRPGENIGIGVINYPRTQLTVVFMSPSMLDAVHILNAYEALEM